MEKTIAELEAATAAAKIEADAAGGTDEAKNKILADAKTALETAKKAEEGEEGDIDFEKELHALENQPKPGERDKAKFTVGKIFERFPDIKEEIVKPPEHNSVEEKLLRNQAEGVIRGKVNELVAGGKIKPQDEASAVRFYLTHYDRSAKTGNLYEDIDNAMWLADKPRTRNAIAETRRVPPEPGAAGGPGQRPQTSDAPELPPEQVKRLTLAGFRLVASGHWESPHTVLKWDSKVKQWDRNKK